LIVNISGSRKPLTLEAHDEQLLARFLSQFNPIPGTYNDRWHILRLLVENEIDWPLWHQHHERVRTEKTAALWFLTHGDLKTTIRRQLPQSTSKESCDPWCQCAAESRWQVLCSRVAFDGGQ
jgi:hypothetical protein